MFVNLKSQTRQMDKTLKTTNKKGDYACDM